ncbi:suppressor of tub2 mutation, partial [Spiromyces aspiralis]
MGTNLEQVARAIQSETDIMSRLAELEKLRSILEKDNHSAKALDSLVPAISSALVSNQIAVCLAAMGAMQGFLEQVSGAENPHLCRSVLHILLPAIINRLGDSKLQIRELALEILCETWRVMQRTNFSHDHNYTLTSTASSPAKRPGLQARLGAHLSHLRTPFRNRAATTTAAAAAIPATAASPAGTTGQWYAASAFEKEIKAQGFRHRTYRVREMCVEWVVQSMETYPEFPTERYLSEIVELLGDNQETMRLTCKSALHKIYWVRQSLPNSRSTVIEEITASGPGNFKSSYRPVVRDMGSPATDSPLRTGSRQAYRSVATSTPSTNRSTKAMPTPINNGSGIPRFGGLHASSIPRFGARSAMANPMSGGYVSHHDPPPPMRPGSRSNLYGARPASREAMMPARPASRAAAVPPPTYPTGIR